ncbi:hypothetical protein BGZ58_001290 [Dissophora ornata]|nr:hypothetical protein BGZ58_001290 [Dissophora ornata]
MEELAATKAAAEMVRSTYKKPEPKDSKTKQPVKHGKPKSGPSDKTKDHQQSKRLDGKSGYKSDNKSDYKTDKEPTSKAGNKSNNKSGGSSYRKRQEQGNEEEEKD